MSMCRLLVSYRPLARLRRESTHSLQWSPAIAAVNRRHRFDRAVTLIGRRRTGRAAYSAYRHQVLQGGQAPGPRLLKQVRWNTNTRCGRVLTALKAAATAATRTRALREARNRRAQHAGRRTTTRKRPSVHQKNAARRVTNAQALGISLTKSEEEALSSLYRRRIPIRRRRRPRHEEHAQI